MSANLVAVNNVDKLIPETQEGAGSFTDLVGSTHRCQSPIVAGIWEVMDFDEPTPAWEAEWDEVKYVIAGELVLKNEFSGEVHELSAGSLLWIPAGAKMSIVRSKNARTIYVEQSYRPAKF